MVIAGLANKPSTVTLTTGASTVEYSLDFAYDAKTEVLTVKKPDVCVVENFDMSISFPGEAAS